MRLLVFRVRPRVDVVERGRRGRGSGCRLRGRDSVHGVGVRRRLAGRGAVLAGFAFRTPRDLRLQTALQQLRLDALLLVSRQFAQRRRHLAVGHFLGRCERHLRTEHTVHLGAQNIHDLRGAVHAFRTDGECERVFAHRGVELDPQARAAAARVLRKVDARHLGAVYVCAHIRGQAAHQRVPTLVGAAVGLGGGLRGLCGLGRRAGRHVGPAGLRGCGGQLSRGVRLGRRLRGGLRGRRLLR